MWRKYRERRKVQECNLKHFILPINLVFAVCFSSFTLSLIPSELETKLDLPLSVKFILMKGMSSTIRSSDLICWVHNNNNFLAEAFDERILYQRRNSMYGNEGWAIEWLWWKTHCLSLSTIAIESRITRDISRKTISCILRLRLNLHLERKSFSRT